MNDGRLPGLQDRGRRWLAVALNLVNEDQQENDRYTYFSLSRQHRVLFFGFLRLCPCIRQLKFKSCHAFLHSLIVRRFFPMSLLSRFLKLCLEGMRSVSPISST